MEEKQKHAEELNATIEKGVNSRKDLERQLADARATMDKYLRDYDALFDRTQKLTEELDGQIFRNKQMHAEKIDSEKEMKLKYLEIGHSLTYSLPYSLTHSLTHSLTQDD